MGKYKELSFCFPQAKYQWSTKGRLIGLYLDLTQEFSQYIG
jgi:hypothetical protein